MKKLYYKYILDVIMTVIILCLMKVSITGILWHELLGIGVFVLFLLHKFLNFAWIKNVLFKLFLKKTQSKIRIMGILDIVLFIDISVIVATGIGISQELFGFWYANPELDLWIAAHHSASYLGLILISVHIGLHWNMILAAFKKLIKIKAPSKMQIIALRLLGVSVMVAGFISAISQNLMGKITEPFTIQKETIDTTENASVIKGYETNTEIEVEELTYVDEVATTDKQTLYEYLSKLFCTACSKHCPLSNPECAKGDRQAAIAETEYYEMYNSSSSSSSKSSSGTASGSFTASSNSSSSSTGESDSGDSLNESNETSSSAPPISTSFEYIPIMGLFIGGAHYTLLIPKKKNSK